MNIYELHADKKQLIGSNLDTDKIVVISAIYNLAENKDEFAVGKVIELITDYALENDNDIENAMIKMARNSKNGHELYLLLLYCEQLKGAWAKAEELLMGTWLEDDYLNAYGDDR